MIFLPLGLRQKKNQANKFHLTIKFTAEISENKTNCLHTTVFKGERFTKYSILDINTHYNPTKTFQCTHFALCHPPGIKNGFIKGKAIRLLRTNSSKKKTFEEPFKVQTPQIMRLPRKSHGKVSGRGNFWL